ncbi:RNA-guided pseudouridylation complex pseudouridine synthase subunit Cbf5 [Candidatus Pacearchaeota archaeon]|nr:RNA-guided pseudouridylation complex pseudouridine synthase subunit Cbf5 [Candidatus Pacearchaeota archaeon]
MEINLDRSIIIIDKPSGPTSFDIVNFVRKTLNLNKASHFGTLDPKVTGVLPLALGRATRIATFFARQNKEYVGVMHIHEDIEQKKIEQVIKSKFLGKITQLPPVKSRVKREEREREIKQFQILEKQSLDILFRVECEAGTYIRKLIHDLGKELGIGAHMTELRRTRAGIFEEKNATKLTEFKEAAEEFKQGKQEKLAKMLIPIEIVTKIIPSITVKEQFLEKLRHGSPLFKEMIEKHEKFSKNQFVAVLYDSKLLEVIESDIDNSTIKNLNSTDIIGKPKTVFN